MTTARAKPTIASITFDCSDAASLASFWGALLGRPVADGATGEYAELEGTPGMTFIAVPEPKTTKNRLHLDLKVDDLASEVERALALGATKRGEFDEGGFSWVTLEDPAGNELDLAVASE